MPCEAPFESGGRFAAAGEFGVEEGGEEDGGSRDEMGEVGRFAKDEEGDEDGDGDFQIIKNGQSSRGSAGGTGVPEEKAQTGGDGPEVEEGGPLARVHGCQFGERLGRAEECGEDGGGGGSEERNGVEGVIGELGQFGF